jgi:hypothetical protein
MFARLALPVLLSASSLLSASVWAQSRGEPLATLAPPAPEGSPTWQVSTGFKAWANQWESWSIDRVQVGSNILQVIETASSPQAVAFIPFISVRRGDFSVTFSRMTETSYKLKNALVTINGSRNETDLNVAWRVLPTINLTAGYKELNQSAGGRYAWRGPVAGVSAQAPLTPSWALYGTLGLGYMQLQLPATDASGQDKLHASYAIHELGAAYASRPAWLPGESSLTLAIGYRSQTVRTKNYYLSSQAATGGGVVSSYGKDDLRDTTQGLTLSLIGTF